MNNSQDHGFKGQTSSGQRCRVEVGEGGQNVQTSSYTINKWGVMNSTMGWLILYCILGSCCRGDLKSSRIKKKKVVTACGVGC